MSYFQSRSRGRRGGGTRSTSTRGRGGHHSNAAPSGLVPGWRPWSGSDVSRGCRGRGGGRGHQSQCRPADHGGQRRNRPRYVAEQKREMQHGITFLSMGEIESLAASDSNNVITCLMENEAGFLAAFSFPRNCSHPATLKHLIKLLYVIVKNDNSHLASRIIAHIMGDTSGMSVFLSNLDLMVKKMPDEIHEHSKEKAVKYLEYIIEIGMFAIAAAPQSVMYTFPYMSVNDTVQRLSQLEMPEDFCILKALSQSLFSDFSDARLNVTIKNKARATRSPEDDTPPPQHFTELQVLPLTEEMQPGAKPPFIRPNITCGSYKDWEHYLDVQFRLMREDFVAPLREGIAQCEAAADEFISEVRVYKRVRVGNPVCLPSGVGFEIHFDVSRLQRVNWEHSKRLIFGSLLCLSCDHFQNILFATVAHRDPKDLCEGCVLVQFEGDGLVDGFQITPDRRYVMVESAAYFEAYRHILEGLRKASPKLSPLTERLSLFKQYLVDCQLKTPVPAPQYLYLPKKTVFHLKEILNSKASRSDVEVLNPASWPSCEDTCLDSSQLKAFIAALTQEISIIQGPPGTGKTFIGLKIVEALVANQQKSSNPLTDQGPFVRRRNLIAGVEDCFANRGKSNNLPILVLCYTNHALDQFLEGIMEINTKNVNIVRIGGRCKSESLEKCTLKEKVKEFREQQSLPFDLHRESGTLREEIRSFQETIEGAQKRIAITAKGNKIYYLSYLKSFIHRNHFLQLTQEGPTERGREIDVWLDLWYIAEYEEQPIPEEQAEKERHERLPEQDSEHSAPKDQDSDCEYIKVDAEAQLLEEDRVLDGEDFHIPKRSVCLPADSVSHTSDMDRLQLNEGKWAVIQIDNQKRRQRIKKGRINKPMSASEAKGVTNIWNLSMKKRWKLYLYWEDQLIRTQKQHIAKTADEYNRSCKQYALCRQEIDAFVIRHADIVGMTTTGAAKYNHVLSSICPRVVIIEEAAEVFEAHVFTSLTPSVQQLIMIGDHKQLQPKANCYKLEKKYNFCVSLFERLVRNGFPLVTLEVQHRMRPEIASLIHPSIYDKLLNHDDVNHYENIKGVGKNLFFIDHTVPEKILHDKDKSHANEHEADFLAALCKYLLKQGYLSSQITLLTTYRGQLLELRKKMKRVDFDGVRVAVVDDFQGEENDIILLSLVRSNSEGNIGFLKIQNRICVLLSRAKMGFYVIGNLSVLRDKDVTVWPEILANVSHKQCIGKALPLYCQNHPQTIVTVSCSKDFCKCPEGGCEKKCNARLDCGHTCPRLCHPTDQEHKLTKCRQSCPRVLKCGHACSHQCWECRGGCPPCSVMVVKRIDLCGHDVLMPCHEEPLNYPCTMPCEKALDCTHTCQERCSRPCTFHCKVKVERKLSCGHVTVISCYLDPSEVQCREPCNELLDCGHFCSGQCELCRRGRLHIRCWSRCDRQLVCGHMCDFPCTPTCPPCMKKCNNYCVHSRCQKKCYEPCVPCTEPCKWNCRHFRCSQRCGEICDRPPCNEPCKRKLKCGHPCIGLCGEKCPSKCRICNKDEVCEIFFGYEDEEDARFIELEECKHLIEVTACDEWMTQKDETGPSEVQFKTCPKCKSQIRKSRRYGNIIKQTLDDYDSIKKKQLMNLSGDVVAKFREVQSEVVEAFCDSCPVCSQLERHMKLLKEQLKPTGQHQRDLPLNLVSTVTAQLTYIPFIVKMLTHLRSFKSAIHEHSLHPVISVEDNKSIENDILAVATFVMQEFLSDQQKHDVQSEIYRILSLLRLKDLWCKVQVQKKQLSSSEVEELITFIHRVRYSGWKLSKLKEEEHDQIAEFTSKVSKKYGVDGLTDVERIEIVEAIGLSKGHWFKCPNGHFYCIGECGGAMEEGKCPECGAGIGGQHHTLLEDNQLAPEMDGARHAAWSEMANLENFDPNELN